MNKSKWIYLLLSISLLVLCTTALLWWYQPWRYGQVEQLTQELSSSDPSVRQQAISTLLVWPSAQQENLLVSQQSRILSQYEIAINQSIANEQWQSAQLWLIDLQKLYPHLTQVQNAQQQMAFNLAQKINLAVAAQNQILVNDKILTPVSLQELTQAQNSLRRVAAEHPLVNDPRVLYLILNSIDEALVQKDFAFAEALTQWGMEHFPNQPSLKDREIQIQYRLAGEPVQTLVMCISEGQHCWQISTATPLFSQPWIVQQGYEHPELAEWNMIPILQNELGQYYRQQALQANETKEPMLAAIALLRASYFTAAEELNGYWQWLVRAFIERKERELQEAHIAALSGLQHTLMTQFAAFDIQGAQRTILALQSSGVDPFFIEGIAMPLLGDTYLDLAEQLAKTQQYVLAVRVLHAGQHFLPRNNAIKLLLSEYTALAAEPETNLYAEESEDYNAMEAIWVQEYARALMEGAESLPTEMTITPEFVDPCARILQTVTLYNAGICQDQLDDQSAAPALVVVPASNTLNHYAIGKYPITIREYNYYCRISRSCVPRVVPQDKAAELAPERTKASTGDIDLADVQEVMKDYDKFCEESGTCNTIEPQAQDKPITDLTYNEAINYTQWLTAATGYTYRLPTLAEWEYAIDANNVEYKCSYDTLLGLPPESVAVQRGTMNDWGIAYQLSFLREWVTTEQGLGLLGPEQIKDLPVCTIPFTNNSAAVTGAANNVGFRLVREING